MSYRVYSGPHGAQAPSPLDKDRMLFKEFASLDEAMGWARHVNNGGRTALLIEEMGGEVKVAYAGEDALKMLEEYQPEVILLDIGMPGLDGYATCQGIRRLLGDGVLLVALTGFGRDQDKEQATRAGFDAHLTKPAEGAALADIVARGRPRQTSVG